MTSQRPRRLAAPWRLLSLWLGAFAALSPSSEAVQGTSRLLIIDFDDLGYDLLADAHTPTLDSIAQNGRTYTRFYSNPLCSPTRASIQTGAYPSHPDVLTGAVIFDNQNFSMPLAPLVPLAQKLEAGGVRAVKIGKWHLCGRSDPTHPNRSGYRDYRGAIENVQRFGEGFNDYPKVINGSVSQVTDTYLTTDEANDTIAALQSQIEFINLSFHAPHKPWHVPPAHLHTMTSINTDRERAMAMMEACDTELARVLAEALPRGYTVLLFSDNGTAVPLGGLKGRVFEGGVNVPMWAIGNGVTPGVDRSLVAAADIYGFTVEFFGLGQQPPQPGSLEGPDSISFLGTLAGGIGRRRIAYVERFPDPGQDPRLAPNDWIRAAITPRYKLMFRQDGFPYWMTDLTLDPTEQSNMLIPPTLTTIEIRWGRYLAGFMLSQ